MTKYYAGIGSRKTPYDIQKVMGRLAFKMANDGYTLRSGGAEGADKAFEYNSGYCREIFKYKDATPEAIDLAMQFHPAPHNCNDYIKKLHGRNAQIILGHDLNTPVEIVYCWTVNGKDIGGTGLGMRLAESKGILVRNLYYPDVLKEIEDMLK